MMLSMRLHGITATFPSISSMMSLDPAFMNATDNDDGNGGVEARLFEYTDMSLAQWNSK